MHYVLSTSRFHFAAMLLLLASALATTNANELNNGGFTEGKITTAGDSGIWLFNANSNDILSINVADMDNGDLAVQAVIYGPDGGVLVDATDDNVVAIHNLSITTSGTYTLEIKDGHTSSSRGNAQTGSYRIYYYNQSVSELGELTTSGFVSDSIERGDIDSWHFTAQAGELFSLNLVDVNAQDLAIHGTLFSPDGTILDDRGDDNVLLFHNIEARHTGTYTLVVKDGHTSSSRGNAQTGTYRAYFYKQSEAEHGALKPNDVVEDKIDTGDIDSWSFNAQAGDRFTISLVDSAAKELAVHGTIFNPDGSVLVDHGDDTVQLFYNTDAKQSGTHTFVVKDGHTSSSRGNSQSGLYKIFFNTPADTELGSLKNTGVVEDRIDLGDLDSWYFDAVEGQTLSLTFTDTANKELALAAIVYAPDGSKFLEGTDDTVLRFNTIKIVQSGRYYVQVQDGHTSSSRGHAQTGAYQIRMTLIPIMNLEKQPSVQIEGHTNGELNQQMVLTAKTANLEEAATYNWSLISSDAAEKDPQLLTYNNTAPTVTFTPPTVGTHELVVTVSTGGKNYTAKHTITVVNHEPVITITAKQNDNNSNSILVEATVSDQDNQALTATWALANKPSDSAAVLSQVDDLITSFVPDKSGVYSVTLSVSDSAVEVSERLDITVALDESEPAPPAPEPAPKPAPAEPKTCDINNDYFVDKYDIAQIKKVLNTPVDAKTDKLDINNDKTIDAADVSYCENECSYEGCNSSLFQ